MKLYRILYTSDPFEPSGTIGLYQTEEQREFIIKKYLEDSKKVFPQLSEDFFLSELHEEEIEIGIYYP